MLVYAFWQEAPEHEAFRRWLMSTINGPASFAMADLVLSGFMRIVTHPRIFAPPAQLSVALKFAEQLRDRPNCIIVKPGPTHWEILRSLVKASNVKGNLIPDCYLAALAIEHGCEWITTDGDFARFPGLRWRHPLTG